MQLVREAIEYGSLLPLLEEKLITGEQIINVLVELNEFESTRSIAAYYLACKLQSPNTYILPDGKNFILKVLDYPIYYFIYSRFGGILDIIPHETISQYLIKNVIDDDFRLKFRINLLINGTPIKPYKGMNVSDFFLYYLTGIKLSPKETSSENGHMAAFETDAFTYLENTKDLIFLLARCTSLRNAAPLYWNIVCSKYKFIIEKLLNNINSIDINDDLVGEIRELFPDINGEILEINNMARKIFLLEPNLRAYVLGFPIHLNLPPESEILKALKYLSQEGIEKYIESVVTFNRKFIRTYNHWSMFSEPGELELEVDSLTNSIYEYNLFDVCLDFSDGHYYAFTRPEFGHLLKTKKHLYMQTFLSDITIKILKNRNVFAEQSHFPKSMPIRDLIDQINKTGNISKQLPPIPIPNEPHHGSVIRGAIIPQEETLRMLQSYFMNMGRNLLETENEDEDGINGNIEYGAQGQQPGQMSFFVWPGI